MDGSGKDSVLNAIFSLFYEETVETPLFFSKYQNVLRTREPTLISSAGRKITEGLSSKEILHWPIKETAKLFIEDRRYHCKFIRKALNEKIIVICSRYDLSTFAYQMAQGVDFEWIYDQHLYHHQSQGCLIPDLTFYLRLSPETAWLRVEKRQKKKKKEAFEGLEFLKKTSQCYERLVKELPKKDNRSIVIIDAEQPLANVKKNVVKALENYFKKNSL